MWKPPNVSAIINRWTCFGSSSVIAAGQHKRRAQIGDGTHREQADRADRQPVAEHPDAPDGRKQVVEVEEGRQHGGGDKRGQGGDNDMRAQRRRDPLADLGRPALVAGKLNADGQQPARPARSAPSSGWISRAG